MGAGGELAKPLRWLVKRIRAALCLDSHLVFRKLMIRMLIGGAAFVVIIAIENLIVVRGKKRIQLKRQFFHSHSLATK